MDWVVPRHFAVYRLYDQVAEDLLDDLLAGYYRMEEEVVLAVVE